MSFIGTIEQFNLATILQKIEGDAKNGLLTIKRESQSVELSFRQGQLMCIGPIRSNKTLGDRLLQVGVISQQAHHEVSTTLGASFLNETRAVIAFIDLGYLNQESLFTWAAQEASKVLNVLLSWSTGKIYFEEDQQPPSDRLLIALTVSSLVPIHPINAASQSVGGNIFSSQKKEQSKVTAISTPISDAMTLHDPSQFYVVSAPSSISIPLDFSEGHKADSVRNTDDLSSRAVPLTEMKRLIEPLTPMRIDTSFMQPQMVVFPTNLSGIRDQNLRLPLTPEQWRLFTKADGNTSLQTACQMLGISSEFMCQIAGELIALGLITVGLADSVSKNELKPFPLDALNAELSNNSVAQVYDRSGNDHFSPAPVETHSQWGNGGTGATFVVGNGWVVTSAQPQPVQTNKQNYPRPIEYAEASGMR